MFRFLILATATIGAIALGSTSASAYVPCSPYVDGMCGQDTEIGIGAMIYHAVGPGGIFAPRAFGRYGYRRPYGYRPYGYMLPYHRRRAWCVGRDQWGRIVSRTPGPCGNGY